MKKIQEKKKKQSKKRLGMGLSSLLSKDEGLASVIKAKINTQIKNGGNSSDQKKPTFDLIKTSVDEKISSIIKEEGFKSLYKGFFFNWARIGTFNLILFVTFEKVQDIFEQR